MKKFYLLVPFLTTFCQLSWAETRMYTVDKMEFVDENGSLTTKPILSMDKQQMTDTYVLSGLGVNSAPKRHPIPIQSDTLFRSKATGYSDPKRHFFRRHRNPLTGSIGIA